MRVKLSQHFSKIVEIDKGKRFVPLHERDRKVYMFSNTLGNSLHIPHCYSICKSIDSFQIKSLRGGFQRRPELIAQCNVNNCDKDYELPKSKAIHIQLELTEAALNLVDMFLHPLSSNGVVKKGDVLKSLHPKLALDVGCGNGLSMIPLINRCFTCVGIDLNVQALSYLNQRVKTRKLLHESESIFSSQSHVLSSGMLDIVRWDLRHGLPFRDNTFDLSISISFLQWLFYGQRSQQLTSFFSSLHRVLCPGGQSIIQFYPRSPRQLADAVNYASRYFKGAVIGDYPHIDRGRKLFLLLIK